ncbi:glycosyltransferase family 8 protein [Campylobacter sp. RM9756]|uniref:glycosyltransferase family 8 protein n=1 Tax=Campylobacter molothri TaxID=1032242 RepID=UPI001D675467|nr:glycosyltransferase family 8 protein [Campylobacter sp. RM9756]
MLDICIGSSSEYLKYASVLIHSIVKFTSVNNSFCQYKANQKFMQDLNEGYCFHIFTERENQDTFNLQKLVDKLSTFYPCKILIYPINNQEFDNFSYPFWCQNPAMFYKLKAPELLKDLDKCLFLGVDLMCVSDIRELFALNLKDNLIAAALDCYNFDGFIRQAKSKNQNSNDLLFSDAKYYINNEVMLINLDQWRKEEISKKCQYYLENYHLEGFVDVFPLVCAPKIQIISNKYNLILGVFTRHLLGLENTFSDESNTPVWNFSKQELEQIMQDIRIVHFCHYVYKPWLSPYNDHYVYNGMSLDVNACPIYYPYYQEWWELALSTPFFKKDFEILKKNIQEKSLDNYAISLSKRFRELRDFQMQNLNLIKLNKEECERIENNFQNFKVGLLEREEKEALANTLPYKLGEITITYRNNFCYIILLPFIVAIFKFFYYFVFGNVFVNYDCKNKNECFKYELGKIILKAHRTWYKGGYFKLWFDIKKLKKQFKNK